MIEVIIKRDGTEQPFDADKLNRWSAWAAENLGGFVDWGGIAMRAVANLPERCSSQTLQEALVQECNNQKTWAYYRMAARLHIPYLRKKMYGGDGSIPTIQEIHKELAKWGLMRVLKYSDNEYAQIERMIVHQRDFNYAKFQIDQIIGKYSLCDRRTDSNSEISGRYFESPQHVYMRMAMALAEDEPNEERMRHVEKWYSHFSNNRLNAPTPNFANLGTNHHGYASCCLIAAGDTETSLGIADYISRAMTVASAGIGSSLMCRSIGDPVRNGAITHQGKIPYYRALAGAVNSSIQNGRGGACTTYFSAYDPEVFDLSSLRHPESPEAKRILTMDFAIKKNKHLVRKAARNEDIFVFNAYTAPDLTKAFYSSKEGEFEALYEKYENDPNFKKEYISARKVVVGGTNITIETGSLYEAYMDEINRHTPFYDPIHSSNLCLEIAEPTSPYWSMMDLLRDAPAGYCKLKLKLSGTNEQTTSGLYERIDETNYLGNFVSVEPVEMVGTKRPFKAAQELEVGDIFKAHAQTWEVVEVIERQNEPEVALCSLAAIVPSYIESDEQYAEVAYYALKMIDKCIHLSSFPLAHVGYTARQRLSAGIGLTGVAHYMAKKRKRYSTIEGKQELHRLAERHAYHVIRASLRLGQELGNAPWIHRTKWPEGWLPIDTYNRNVDSIAPFENQFDWEQLRKEIIANGGIRNSTLIAHMPTESSSKASGIPNGLYPIRDFNLGKTDNNAKIDWAPTDGDKLKRYYEIAWDIPYKDQLECYAIVQKFTDQAISADRWVRLEGDSAVYSRQLLDMSILMAKFGVKTGYYFNSKTSKTVKDETTGEETVVEITKEFNLADKCTNGGCDA